MALYTTPEEHAANPPETWCVVKVAGRLWALRDRAGSTLQSYPTRRAAEEGKRAGFYADLYDKEGRWFRGDPVAGWKPYAVCVGEG